MTNRNLIIVEFSVSQQAFHRHTMQDMLFTNIKNIFQNKSIDYVPVASFETMDEADEFIETVRDKFLSK